MHQDRAPCIYLPHQGTLDECCSGTASSLDPPQLHVEIGHIVIRIGGCGTQRAPLNTTALHSALTTSKSVLTGGIGILIQAGGEGR